jgi:hypothetical protein
MSEHTRRHVGGVSGAALTERRKELLGRLAKAVGAGDTDVDDEHARWQVYWNAAPNEDLRVLLKELVGEGEELSRQVVVEVLKYVDEIEGRAWVGLLPHGEDRDFAERRLREWALIRESVERPRRIADELPNLTPWCQRRLIDRATSDLVLGDIADGGSSKRIRHAAREKRAGRWKGWQAD